jgi:hypothetical protein
MSTLSIQDLLLAQYINTKINHDLINVCGALNQAVDFLNDNNKKMREQAEDLVKNCAKELTSRLKILREIYGVSHDKQISADLTKLKDLIKENLNKHQVKITLDWRLENEDPNICADVAKIILSLAVLCIKKLVYGGSLIISSPEDSEVFTIVISAMGKNIVHNDNQNNLINTPSDIELSINTIEIIYIKHLAKLFKFNLSVEQEDNFIKYQMIKETV